MEQKKVFPPLFPTDLISNTLTVMGQFRSRVLGGIPKAGDPLDFYCDRKFESDEEKAAFKDRVSSGELTDEERDEIKKSNWTTFEISPEGYICYWHGNVKKMVVEAMNALGLTSQGVTEDGKKVFKYDKQHNLQVGVSVQPHHISLLLNGEPQKSPEAYMDKVKNLKDKFGHPASALGRHDYCDRATFEFDVLWTKNEVFSVDDMILTLIHTQTGGLGACRSQGFGQFDIIGLKLNGEVLPPAKLKEIAEKLPEVLEEVNARKYKRPKLALKGSGKAKKTA